MNDKTITMEDCGELEHWDGIRDKLVEWARNATMPRLESDPPQQGGAHVAVYDERCVHELEVMCPSGLETDSLPHGEQHIRSVWTDDQRGDDYPVEVYVTVSGLLSTNGTQGVRFEVRYE